MNAAATARPRPLFGVEGEFLNGPESRALRTALNLERRHIVALCNALGLVDGVTTMDRVTSWEKSKGRGYPPEVMDTLNALERAVGAWSVRMVFAGMVEDAAGRATVTLRRPLGAKKVHQELDLASWGLSLPPGALRILDHAEGEIWHALAGGAITRAALLSAQEGAVVRVELDRQPDEAVSPPAQSARGYNA